MDVGFRSDIGKRRTNNEDAYVVLDKNNIFVVADGVGGSNSGEIASKIAVEKVSEFVETNVLGEEKTANEIGSYMQDCIRFANNNIIDAAKDNEEYKGMATTIVVCFIEKNKAYFANIGDSRAYIFREKELFQLTEDHTYVNSLVKMGVITQEEAQDHKKGHIITRAVGINTNTEADFYQTDLKDNDILLLCTDGLTGELSNEKIEKIINEECCDMKKLAKQLVEAANRAGGKDNITVISIKYSGGSQNE